MVLQMRDMRWHYMALKRMQSNIEGISSRTRSRGPNPGYFATAAVLVLVNQV